MTHTPTSTCSTCLNRANHTTASKSSTCGLKTSSPSTNSLRSGMLKRTKLTLLVTTSSPTRLKLRRMSFQARQPATKQNVSKDRHLRPVCSKQIKMQYILIAGTGTTERMSAQSKTNASVEIATPFPAQAPFSPPCLLNTIRRSNFILSSR